MNRIDMCQGKPGCLRPEIVQRDTAAVDLFLAMLYRPVRCVIVSGELDLCIPLAPLVNRSLEKMEIVRGGLFPRSRNSGEVGR